MLEAMIHDLVAWSPYTVVLLSLLPAVVVFFIMYYRLLRSRMAHQLAEARLYDQGETLALQQQLQQQLQDQLSQSMEVLSARALEHSSQRLMQRNTESMAQLLNPLRERIDGFQQRINHLHDQSLRDNVRLGEQIELLKVMGLQVGEEAQALTRALKGDKKALGSWGEAQLELCLQQAGLVKDRHYQLQPAYRNHAGELMRPDVVVLLPDHKHIVVDSKVSLVDYYEAVRLSSQVDAPHDKTPHNMAPHNKAQHAIHDVPYDEHDKVHHHGQQHAQREARVQQALQAHIKAIRRHIDDLSRKDYSQLQGLHSPGFVLLFMPLEAAFIEALKTEERLYHEAFQKQIILTSPMTLLPLLKTIGYLWMLSDGRDEAMALGDEALAVYNQVALVSEHMDKLGNQLDTAMRSYNAMVRSFAGQQGVTKKLSRFSQLSAKTARAMADVQPVERCSEAAHYELEPQPLEPQPLDSQSHESQGNGIGAQPDNGKTQQNNTETQ